MPKCKLCDNEFVQITHTHLESKHNISLEEYKERFPKADIGSTEGAWEENHTPWNKGKERSEKTRKKISSKAKERWNKPEERKKQSERLEGKEPWNKGLSAKVHKSIKNYVEKQKGQNRTGNYPKGEEHYNWKGGPLKGSSHLGGSWSELAKEITERDGYRCQCCGASDVRLEVHHLWPRRYHQGYKYSKNELITLCVKCHRIWEKHYYELMQAGDIPAPEEVLSWN